MPAEYKNCVKSEIARGKSKKEAQRICAIAYYKRHGRTPQQDEASIDENEKMIFNIIDLLIDSNKSK